MTIGISLNEVLRDFLSQFVYVYTKYIGPTDIKEGDITDFNLLNYFPTFANIEEFNRFLYLESPLEIFGHADQMSKGLIQHLNDFVMDIKDDGEHEVILVSKEANKSIPATYFFLSKTGCRAEKVNFIQQSQDEWNGIDILITANPDALKAKPNGKISVKVNASYNTESTADFTIDSILELFMDESLRDKIFNNKITTYEEI